MCNLCRLFRSGRNNGCGCGCENETVYTRRRVEPRMHVHCESGYGRADNAPCGCEPTCNTCRGYERSCDNDCDCDCD